MSVIRNSGPITVTQGRSGFEAIVGPFGETIVADSIDNISVQFQYNLYEEDVTSSTAGDGAVVQEASYAKVSSTTGSASLQSRDTLRYKPGHTAIGRLTTSFVGNGTGMCGLFDSEDGVYIKRDAGITYVGYRNAGVDTEVAETAFNGDNISEIDWTKINVFSITFGWLGVAPILVEVMRSDGSWVAMHKFKTAGKLTTTHIGNAVIPMRVETSGDMEIKTASWNGQILGDGSKIGNRPFSFPITALSNGTTTVQGEMALTGTNVGTVAIFSSKDTFQGKTNKVKARLTSFEFSVPAPAGNVYGSVVFQLIGNPTFSGAPTYSDINANGSVIQYDHAAGTGASVTYVSGGKILLTTEADYLGASKGGSAGSAGIDAEKIGAIAYSGDNFAVIAQDLAGNNVKVRIKLNWEELF